MEESLLLSNHAMVDLGQAAAAHALAGVAALMHKAAHCQNRRTHMGFGNMRNVAALALVVLVVVLAAVATVQMAAAVGFAHLFDRHIHMGFDSVVLLPSPWHHGVCTVYSHS